VKPAVFHRRARDAIRSFPVDVRRAIGEAVWTLELGRSLSMPLSRTM